MLDCARYRTHRVLPPPPGDPCTEDGLRPRRVPRVASYRGSEFCSKARIPPLGGRRMRVLVLSVAILLALACGNGPPPPPPPPPAFTPTPTSTITPTATTTPTPTPTPAACQYTSHPEARTRGAAPVAPSSPVIKGNISQTTGEKIYHVPGQRFYTNTVVNEGQGERYFCTENEAERAGWRKSRVENLRPGELHPALVLRIIDGDTIEADINGTVERVRYAGIDTPEKGEPCAAEATERNAALVGQRVYLEPSIEDRDRYGRLVRYVWTENGSSVDQMLLAEGYARAWYGPGTHRLELIATAEEANQLLVGCLFAALQ